jgi:hypothetical protein
MYYLLYLIYKFWNVFLFCSFSSGRLSKVKNELTFFAIMQAWSEIFAQCIHPRCDNIVSFVLEGIFQRKRWSHSSTGDKIIYFYNVKTEKRHRSAIKEVLSKIWAMEITYMEKMFCEVKNLDDEKMIFELSKNLQFRNILD